VVAGQPAIKNAMNNKEHKASKKVDFAVPGMPAHIQYRDDENNRA
jgi:hypothetical protein